MNIEIDDVYSASVCGEDIVVYVEEEVPFSTFQECKHYKCRDIYGKRDVVVSARDFIE